MALRSTPVVVPVAPIEVEGRDGWVVVLEYEDEGGGPWIVDLSHGPRWDFQDRRIDEQRPFGLDVPAEWGSVGRAKGLLISRMNRTQISIWHIGPEPPPETPAATPFTDTTDSHCWIAILGDTAPRVMEALTGLDLFPPGAAGPRLTQGPVLHVPAQIVAFPGGGEFPRSPAALITVARGYGRTFVDAILHATPDLGLRPAGERAFTRWVAAGAP